MAGLPRLLSRIVLLDGCMINCFRRFLEWLVWLSSRHRVERSCRALPSDHLFSQRLLVWTSQLRWCSCQMLKVIQKSKDSRNDLTCWEVWNQKTDHSDHCPTAICLFSFFWIAGVVVYKLRLCFTAKDVLLTVLSNYLRWGRTCHYWNCFDVIKCKVLFLQFKDTVGYGFF